MRWRKKTIIWAATLDYLERRQLLALVLTAETVFASAQVPFSSSVASLIDTNLGTTPSDFNNPPGSVKINWGDGSAATSGTVVGSLIPGFFEVDGSHTYTSGGSFSTQVTVTDQNNVSANANGTAVVTVPPLTIAGNAFSGTAGVAPKTPPVVATFLDTNTADTSADFNALISWGDGHASAGVVQGTNGVFTVTGTNTYAAPGTYTTTITIVGIGTAPSGTATGSAKIGSASSLAGHQIVAIAGQQLPNPTTVATFTDSNTSDTASNFTALINWGDGGTSAGTVIGGSGSFMVQGTYTYTVPGSYVATITIGNSSGASFTATDSVTVANSNPPGGSFAFTAMLSSVGNGPFSTMGYTKTNQPTFSGTAPPFATVMVYAKPTHIDATLPLGEAVTNGSGVWTLTAGPLAPGPYFISATVTPAGGSPSEMMLLTVNNGKIYIDMAPKKITRAARKADKSPAVRKPALKRKGALAEHRGSAIRDSRNKI